MTAEDIIAANPDVKFRSVKIGAACGLIAIDKAGTETFVIWKEEYHAACAYPLPRGAIGVMKGQIERAIAHARKIAA